MDDQELLGLLRRAADGVRGALGGAIEWGPDETRDGHYLSDLVADAAALDVLVPAGMSVLSEESAWGGDPSRELVVVVDPLDGSTNASRGIPWYATSLCACDGDGPRVAVVMNLVSGEVFEAIRGQGAWHDGEPMKPPAQRALADSLVAVSGLPPEWLGWRQYRAMGAAALDLCSVAAGAADAYFDFSADALSCWDYLGALLVCSELGLPVVDVDGRDLVVLDHSARRNLVAASSGQLLQDLQAAHSGLAR